MPSLQEVVSEAIKDFQQVAALARTEFLADKITIEIAPKPHKAPTVLPAGRMAVYAFFLNGQALKVGKAGPKSSARYTSQHYNPASAMSTLARSILTNPAKVGISRIDPAAP